MAEPRAISEIAEKETALFLAEQARQFVDCSINLAASSMPIPAVIKLLRDHIALLEDFG